MCLLVLNNKEQSCNNILIDGALGLFGFVLKGTEWHVIFGFCILNLSVFSKVDKYLCLKVNPLALYIALRLVSSSSALTGYSDFLFFTNPK